MFATYPYSTVQRKKMGQDEPKTTMNDPPGDECREGDGFGNSTKRAHTR